MLKYNEIMNNVTVDPEMKKRIMSSVSAAIKEQSKSAGPVRRTEVRKAPESAKVTRIPEHDAEVPARKKAKKTPVVVISTIAAGILVILGVLFVFRYLNTANKAAETINLHNASVEKDENWIFAGADAQAEEEYYAETTTSAPAESVDNAAAVDRNFITTGSENDEKYKSDLTLDTPDGKITPTFAGVYDSEGMGDARLDAVSKSLPFDLKGTGSGQYSDTITEEVFFGNDAEKVLLFTGPEGTDLYKTLFHADAYTVSEGTTPEGYAVKYCRAEFGNVTVPAEGEISSDVNAAIFSKDGKSCLIIFSDIQPAEVIAMVIDAV